METKDQRLEMRVKQQTLDSMDEIIASINTPYKLSRSDLGRTFIEQGIERHYGRGPKEDGLFPLAARLNIFFQLCQLQRMECAKENRSVPPIGPAYVMESGYNNRTVPNTVTAEALVRRIYLQRMAWFFELDAMHLKSIHDTLGQELILSLMNPQPSQEICNTLESVMALRNMFTNIGMVIAAAEKKVNDWNDQPTRDALVRIKGYANDNELPLTFPGYPATEDFKLHIEMWSLLNWIGNGEGGQHITEYGLRQDEDLTDKYAVMLEVYQNIRSNLQFDLNGLEQMVKSRQFYML